jgi:hypothetical protein
MAKVDEKIQKNPKCYKEQSRLKNLIVAYSRAKNLRDILMKTTMSEPEGRNVPHSYSNNFLKDNV